MSGLLNPKNAIFHPPGGIEKFSGVMPALFGILPAFD